MRVCSGLRGSGRTHRMVEKIPEHGAIVVIPTAYFTGYIRPMIGRVRGALVLSRCLFAPIYDEDDVDRLNDYELPVFIDHGWWEVLGHNKVSIPTIEYLWNVHQWHERFLDGPSVGVAA